MKTFSACLFVCLTWIAVSNAEDDAKDLKSVTARTLKLSVPANWQEQKTTSSMRAAQFTIPGDPNDAEMVVFYFGGPTGGIRANVERWIGQFKQVGLELKMYQGKCTAGSYILVDTKGTWNKPDGPPFARKTVEAPLSRVLNVIVIEDKENEEKDYYFLKLSGDQDVVAKQTKVIRAAIGADVETEKDFDLKDAK